MYGDKAILLLALATALLSGCDGARSERDASTPSGKAVPRYVALRVDEANARAGPSEEHGVLWVYHAKGLPVQIIAETKDWRRICDPEGGISWVASRLLEGSGTTVIRMKAGPLDVHRSAEADSGVVASLAERESAQLSRCEDGWCKIKVGKTNGWVPLDEVWGADPKPQCAGLPAPKVTGR